MIIDAVAAGPVRARLRQAPQIAPIVVGEEQGDVVRHPHAGVVIILHLLVERPDLRRLGRGAMGDLLDDPPLVGDDALEQAGRGAFGHRPVAVAAHPDGDDPLLALGALHPLAPEWRGAALHSAYNPRALAVMLPIDMGAHQRLVMRGADHDAHLVGEPGIFADRPRRSSSPTWPARADCRASAGSARRHARRNHG